MLESGAPSEIGQRARTQLREDIDATSKGHAAKLGAEIGAAAEASAAQLSQTIRRIANASAKDLGEEVARLAATSAQRASASAAAENREATARLLSAAQSVRSGSDPAAALAQLVDVMPRIAGSAALVLQQGARMVGFRCAGLRIKPESLGMREVAFELATAPALAHAVESRQAVRASGGQDSISRKLADACGFGDEQEVRLHPVLLRNTVLGVLLVAPDPQLSPDCSAIELLVLLAEAWIEAVALRSARSQTPLVI